MAQVPKQIRYLEAVERRVPVGVQVAQQPKPRWVQLYSRPKLGAQASNPVFVFAFYLNGPAHADQDTLLFPFGPLL